MSAFYPNQRGQPACWRHRPQRLNRFAFAEPVPDALGGNIVEPVAWSRERGSCVLERDARLFVPLLPRCRLPSDGGFCGHDTLGCVHSGEIARSIGPLDAKTHLHVGKLHWPQRGKERLVRRVREEKRIAADGPLAALLVLRLVASRGASPPRLRIDAVRDAASVHPKLLEVDGLPVCALRRGRGNDTGRVLRPADDWSTAAEHRLVLALPDDAGIRRSEDKRLVKWIRAATHAHDNRLVRVRSPRRARRLERGVRGKSVRRDDKLARGGLQGEQGKRERCESAHGVSVRQAQIQGCGSRRRIACRRRCRSAPPWRRPS